MSPLALPPLSLYVHIPWCQRKCPYCDFNSHEAGNSLPESHYVDALLRDLEMDLELAQGRALQSIFIGGGTPSLFSATAIARLLQGIAERIDIVDEAEITLEANPGSAEADKFGAFVEAGVNRISLGVQSFDDELLAAEPDMLKNRAAAFGDVVEHEDYATAVTTQRALESGLLDSVIFARNDSSIAV